MSKRHKRKSNLPIQSVVAVATNNPLHKPFPVWTALALLLFSIAVFWRAVTFDFVNLDDNSNLVKNPAMHNIALAWEKPYLDAYLPVVYSVWRGLYALAERNPVDTTTVETWSPMPELDAQPFHAANLLLHAVNAVLLCLILRTVFPALHMLTCAGFAALFAVHPLQVEPVAWVTALKDVLSGSFALLLIYLYIRQPLTRLASLQHIALLTLIFLLACLTKSTRLFLPIWLVWLGCLHWQTPWQRLATALWPLFMIALVIMLIAMVAQPTPKDMAFQELWRRPFIALDALAFYTGKLFWPHELALDYGRNPRFLFESGTVYIPAALCASGLTAICLMRQRLSPWLLLGLGGFVLSLAPLLGFKPFVFQTTSTVSDRYLYLSIALLLIGLADLWSRIPARIGASILTMAIFVCALKSTQQLPVWQNSASLWRHTLMITPDSGIAHNNLASIHETLGQLPEAIHHYEQATTRLPLAQIHARIAILYSDQQNWQKAQEWNERGLLIEPGNTLLLNNRTVFETHLKRRAFRISK
jgi:hypothetical protein